MKGTARLKKGVRSLSEQTGTRVRLKNLYDFNRKLPDKKMSRWLLVIDEYSDLMDSADNDTKKRMEILVKRILQKGRAAGIHVVIATQKASAQEVPTVLRDNLPAKAILKVADGRASQMMLKHLGAQHLLGKGDCLFVSGGKPPRRMQFASCEE